MAFKKGLRAAGYTLIGIICVLVLDLPVRFSTVVDVPSYLGLKNMLAPMMGLLLGPWGVIGTLLGVLTTGFIGADPIQNIIFEGLCVILESVSLWLLWHAFSQDHRVRFRKATDFIKLLVMLAAVSLASAALSFFFFAGGDFVRVFVVHLFTGSVLGIPVVMLFNMVFCVEPVIPSWCTLSYDVEGVVLDDDDSFDEFSDQLVRYMEETKSSHKEIKSVVDTVTEVYNRINEKVMHEPVKIEIDFNTATVIIKFEYGGISINPLDIRNDESIAGLAGLRLIQREAVRTSYKYSMSVNHVTVIL